MKKVAVITGSSSGIGQATAFAFAKEGWNVVVTYHSSKKEGQATEKECLKLGAESVMLAKLDVLNNKSIAALAKAVKAEYGHVDVLVNNAGIVVFKMFKDYDFKEIEKELRIDLESVIKVTHAFIPFTKQAIVNISSRLGLASSPNVSVYGAAKWGVRGFTKNIALEHPKLLVISVNPSLTATKMTDFEGLPPSKVADLIIAAVNGTKKVPSGGDINVWEEYHQTPPRH